MQQKRNRRAIRAVFGSSGPGQHGRSGAWSAAHEQPGAILDTSAPGLATDNGSSGVSPASSLVATSTQKRPLEKVVGGVTPANKTHRDKPPTLRGVQNYEQQQKLQFSQGHRNKTSSTGKVFLQASKLVCGLQASPCLSLTCSPLAHRTASFCPSLAWIKAAGIVWVSANFAFELRHAPQLIGLSSTQEERRNSRQIKTREKLLPLTSVTRRHWPRIICSFSFPLFVQLDLVVTVSCAVVSGNQRLFLEPLVAGSLGGRPG